jgi:hypothetical protein
MRSAGSIDPRDLELLRRIQGGEEAFRPAEGQRGNEPEWLDTVERLRRLADRGLIRMPEPEKFFLMPGAGYLIVGPCELTADGRDALNRHRR